MGSRIHVLVLGIVALMHAAVQGAASTIEVESPSMSWAIDPQTGVVAGVNPSDSVICFFKQLPQPTAITAPVPKTPVDVIFKAVGDKRYFVVASIDAAEMAIFDAATLKEVKRITAGVDRVSSLAASTNPDDPYVYYCGGNGHDSRVARMDLSKMTDQGVVKIAGAYGSVMRCAISPAGDLIYSLGPWSPSGFQVNRLDPVKPQATDGFYEHDSRGGYAIDPGGQYVGAGQALYTPDLRRELGRTSLEVIAFAPDAATAFAIDRGRKMLVGFSTNTFKDVTANSIDAAMIRFMERPEESPRLAKVQASRQADFKRVTYKPEVLFDSSRKRLLLCFADMVSIYDYADVMCKEPILRAKLTGPSTASPGIEYQAQVVPEEKSVKVELGNAPHGVKLIGGRLTWTPTSGDIGRQAIELKLIAGELSRKQTVELTVSMPSIALSFAPTSMAVSDDGKLALVVRNSQRDQIREEAPASQQLAVVDLVGRKVLCQRDFPQNVAAMAISSKGVLVASSESNALYVLSVKDLSETRRLFAPDPVLAMSIVNGDQVYAATSTASTVVVSLPGLEASTPEPFSKQGTPLRSERRVIEPPVWTGEGWAWAGAIYDAQMKRPVQLLGGPTEFAEIGNARAADPTLNMQQAASNRWGVFLDSVRIIRRSLQPVGTTTDGNGQSRLLGRAIMTEQPLLVQLVSTVMPSGRGNTVSLRYVSLFDGQTAATVKLFQGQLRRQRDYDFFGGTTLAIPANTTTAVAIVEDQLYVVELPKDLTPKTPLHITFEQPLLAVTSEETKSVQSSVSGGTKPYRFSTKVELPGVTVSEASGDIKIVGRELSDHAMTTLVQFLSQTRQPYVQPSITDRLGEYRRNTLPQYRKLFDKEPTGVPVILTLPVQVEDRDLMNNLNNVTVVFEVSLAAMNEKLKSVETAQRTQPEPAHPMSHPKAPTGSAADARLEQRVAELERQVGRLSAQIDLLTQLLGRQSDTPTTKPAR